MKLPCCLAVVLAVMWLSSSQAEAMSIEFVPSTQSVSSGASLDVELRIAGLGDLGAPSLGTFDLDVAFDPAILSFDAAVYGDAVLGDQLDLLGLGSLTITTPGVGVVNLFELSFDSPDDLNTLQAGAFTLATLSFDAVGGGTSALSLSVNALGDAEGQALEASISPGSVTVTPLAAVPEPATLLLLAAGFAGMSFRAVKRLRPR